MFRPLFWGMARAKGQGRKGKGAKEMCVPGLPQEIFAAKGVNVRRKEAPSVGKACVGWAGIGSRAAPGYGPLGSGLAYPA